MSDSILDVEMRRVRRNAERTLNLRRRTRQFESLDARDLEKLDRRILMVRPPPHLAVHQEDDRSLRRRTADSIILFKCKGDRDKARSSMRSLVKSRLDLRGVEVLSYSGAEEHCSRLRRLRRDPFRLRLTNLPPQAEDPDILKEFPEADGVRRAGSNDAVLTFPDEHRARDKFDRSEDLRIRGVPIMVLFERTSETVRRSPRSKKADVESDKTEEMVAEVGVAGNQDVQVVDLKVDEGRREEEAKDRRSPRPGGTWRKDSSTDDERMTEERSRSTLGRPAWNRERERSRSGRRSSTNTRSSLSSFGTPRSTSVISPMSARSTSSFATCHLPPATPPPERHSSTLSQDSLSTATVGPAPVFEEKPPKVADFPGATSALDSMFVGHVEGCSDLGTSGPTQVGYLLYSAFMPLSAHLEHWLSSQEDPSTPPDGLSLRERKSKAAEVIDVFVSSGYTAEALEMEIASSEDRRKDFSTSMKDHLVQRCRWSETMAASLMEAVVKYVLGNVRAKEAAEEEAEKVQLAAYLKEKEVASDAGKGGGMEAEERASKMLVAIVDGGLTLRELRKKVELEGNCCMDTVMVAVLGAINPSTYFSLNMLAKRILGYLQKKN